MFEYCCHLVRIERETMQEVPRLEKAFLTVATGIYKAPLPWFRKLLKLEDFYARRIRLRDKMRIRTSECDRLDNSLLEKALTIAGDTEPSKYTESVWNEADLHRARRLPIPNNGLYQAFYLKKHVHRVLSMKWFLHRFSARPHGVREKLGGIGNIVMNKLKTVLPYAIWSKKDTRDVIGAIDTILDQLPS